MAAGIGVTALHGSWEQIPDKGRAAINRRNAK